MAERLYEFGAALLDPDLPVPPGIVGPDGRPSPRRFAVYRNNVVASLIDAIAAAYPVVQRLVGEQFFRAMARIYVAKHPPSSPIMLSYGDRFAEFVEAFPPAASVPYLADVARLERAWLEAYHASDARSVGLTEIARIAPDQFSHLSLQFHPSLRFISSPFPAATIWLMNVVGGTPAPLNLSIGEHVLVMRPQGDVEVRIIDADSAAFLSALRDGKTPGEAIKRALVLNPRFDLVGNLSDLMNLGLITGWSYGNSELLSEGIADVS